MAYIKLCPECESRSISATKKEWICPHCGLNLSDEPIFREIKIEKNIWGSISKEKDQAVLA